MSISTMRGLGPTLLPLVAVCLLGTPASGQWFSKPERRLVSPPWSGPETCKPGFVWREACGAQDRVCVPLGEREIARRQNAEAAGRRQPGPYGPNTCLSGFVWREACPGDQVCVPLADRGHARAQNGMAASRRLVGDMAPATCADGYVWREACPGDVACVTPLERDVARRQNVRAPSRVSHQGGPACRTGYVWREACGADDRVCVPPEDRTRAWQQNSAHTQSMFTRADWCDSYAASWTEHIHQLDLSGDVARCSLRGPRWVKDYTAHFTWCLGQPWSAINAESNARHVEHQHCGPRRTASCDEYAASAVAQHRANVGFGCGLTGAPWSDHAAGHHGWCMAQPSWDYPRRETERREAQLRTCRERINYWNQQNAQQAQGARHLTVYNCAGRPIHIWSLGTDGTVADAGPIAAAVPCDSGAPFQKDLVAGVLYRFVAVDPQMDQCGGRNDPNYVTCKRDEFFLRGDAGGVPVTIFVPRRP